MTQADRIRAFAIRKFFSPAKAAGRSHVTIKAGDVHRMMGLNSAYPAVCSALRGNKLQSEAGVDFRGQEGPLNGANVLFRYDLPGAHHKSGVKADAPVRPDVHLPAKRTRGSKPLPALSCALVLVSCSKAKLDHSAPARELYCSLAFRMKRRIIERAGADWLILSAKHGLVEPDAVIAPYDLTLNTMGVAARQLWARDVISSLLERTRGKSRVVIFAGQTYSQYLTGSLAENGIAISEPLRGLRQGEQLAWLSKHQ